jgi:hypothetical protein
MIKKEEEKKKRMGGWGDGIRVQVGEASEAGDLR